MPESESPSTQLAYCSAKNLIGKAYLGLCLLFARATLLVFCWLARLVLFCGHSAERDASPVALEIKSPVMCSREV